MHLRILDYVDVKTEGLQSDITKYLRDEYGYFEATEKSRHAPDIVIEFVEEMSSLEQSVHVRDPISYDNEGVFIHDPDYHVVRIDFEAIGQSTCHVTCDVNFNQYFLSIIMEYLVHFYMVKKEAVFCHSSAFKVDGSVILCPAWRNVGKTNLLLAFLKDGAEYISDDWSVLHSDATIRSLAKRIQLLHYNFDAYPELLDYASDDFVALARFIMLVKKDGYDLDQRTLSALEQKARLRLSPYKTFKQEFDTSSMSLDHVFLLKREMNNDAPVTATKIDTNTLVSKMSAILEFEQSYFHLAYLAHKAQIGKPNPFLDTARERSFRVMHEAMDAMPSRYQVTLQSRHSSEEVHTVISQLIAQAAD